MKKRHNSIITVAMMLIAMAPAAFGQYNDEYMAAPPLNEDFYIEDSTSADSNWNGGSVTTGYQTYTIKKGDTLGSISKKFFGTTTKWKLIAETNNISNPGAIKIGQVLEIPATKLERGQGTLMRQQPQNDYQSSMYSNQNYNGNSYNPSLGYPTYQEPIYQPISAYGGGTIGSSYDAMPTAPAPDNSVTNLPLPPVTSNDDAVIYSDAGLPQIILPGSGDNSRFRLKSEERYDVSFSGLTGLVNTYSAFTLGENKFSTAIGFMWNSIEKREGNRLVAGEEGDFYRFPFILTYSGENFEVA
ncbi:MAG: LysM peptidoglycan-binding domain-containing protein, partial [Candidatus Riflebacteria bacterium]|nr:LysM peptidoglycan-binding domain-containing protein [Candidatus Riflebacteria bacterium]